MNSVKSVCNYFTSWRFQLAGQFMKKCSNCGSFGAAYQTTNDKGDAIQLCHDCRQKIVDQKNTKETNENGEKE
jgi:hypothetical protein